MTLPENAPAWGLPHVIDFFEERRASTSEVYPSEWFFLGDKLREGISVLDIGCAQGGFANVIGEHVSEFRYTGIDINAAMIRRAREKHPGHAFHHVPENDYHLLGDERFDLVLVLGILHLHETWRDTIAAAWDHTRGSLILDLRETEGETVEDRAVSYMKMDFHGGGAEHARVRLPYNIINAVEALATVTDLCSGAKDVRRYGYEHTVSGSTVTPVKRIITTAYGVER